MKKEKGLDIVIAVGKPKGKGGPMMDKKCDMCEGEDENCPFCGESEEEDMTDEGDAMEMDDLGEEDIDMPSDEEEMDMESSDSENVLQALKNEDPVGFEASLRSLFDKWMAEK